MKTYSSYIADIPRIINNSLADNVTWATEVINDSIRYLVTKYYFNERTYSTVTVAQQQFYNLPPQIKKLTNVTVTIGSVLWQPKESPTRQHWDALNVTTFYQDFPSYFFVFNGQVGIWPKPSSAGNIITMNYKTRIPDISQADLVVTGVSGSTGISITTNTITGTVTGATASQSMADSSWIRIPHSTTDTINGDNKWYEISSISGAGKTIVLKNSYAGPTVSGGSFTIGEAPILPEDYQDLPLYRLGVIYYTTRFPDPTRAQLYQKLYDDGEARLNEEFGSKTSSVVLNDTDEPIYNPNLFQRVVS
jgi:hypothetical protein